LDIGALHVQRSVLLRHTHKLLKGPYTICVGGAKMSDTGAEAVKLDSRCSWQGQQGH